MTYDMDAIINNFPNTVAYIKFLIENLNAKDLVHVPVTMQIELYQYYIEDSPEDFMGDLFYSINIDDKREIFNMLKNPMNYNKVEFRSYVIKYLFENYQEFFNEIFTHLRDEMNANEMESPFVKRNKFTRSFACERLHDAK